MCPSPVFGYLELEPLTPSAMIINRPDLIAAVSKLAAVFSAPKSLTQLQQMGLVSWLSTARQLAPFMRGWSSYFGFCETHEVLVSLTRWVRLRIRAAMWRQWKTPRRRREALIELGVRSRLASNTAGSGLGPWYLAKAKALSVGLSNAYLRSLGLPSLVEE
jgi:hypothetical protein